MYITWLEINELVDILYNKIIESKIEIGSLHGVKRGGLIPTVLLSHKLNLPINDIICHNTLVIDDICDSGETLQKINHPLTAVLIHKPHTSPIEPMLYAKHYWENDWIIFPWEDINSPKLQNYKINNND